jgi:PGF-CTERM protein
MAGNSTIWAYCADDASVFSSIKIYFSAPGPSWTGYVVDSFGSGYGGVNVKLHVIGYDRNGPYEIYNMTRKTGSSPPFAGLFTFDYIVLEGPAYGYVDAETRLTDNLTIYGKSDNFSINGSAMPIGNIVLNIPPPDAIKITAEKGTVIAGGEEDWITARLYLNGSPYRRADVNVTFSSDNDTIATLPTVKTNATDLDGRAMILLVSNYTAGTVNIAGEAAIMNNYYFTDTAIVRVAGLAGPSAMATPTPGFEALLALAGLLGSAYLIVMRDNQ